MIQADFSKKSSLSRARNTLRGDWSGFDIPIPHIKFLEIVAKAKSGASFCPNPTENKKYLTKKKRKSQSIQGLFERNLSFKMAFAGRSLHFSDEFVISCGTVSLDVARSKVLLVRCRRRGEYMLPKGRKDIDESLEETALRETFEETGIRVQLLPVDINSLATLPSSIKIEDPPRAITEPIAVNQRITRQGILKIIFWYVAAADSTTTPEEGTQQENEDFDTVWADFDNVGSTLSFVEDLSIAEAAIAAVRRGVAPAS